MAHGHGITGAPDTQDTTHVSEAGVESKASRTDKHHVRLVPAVHDRLRHEAFRRNTSMKDIATVAIEQWLDENQPQNQAA